MAAACIAKYGCSRFNFPEPVNLDLSPSSLSRLQVSLADKTLLNEAAKQNSASETRKWQNWNLTKTSAHKVRL